MAPAALFFSSVLPLSPLSLSLFLPFFACLFVCVCGVLSRTIFLRGAARMRRSRWLSGHRSANRPGDPTPPPTPPTEMGEWREVEGGGGGGGSRRSSLFFCFVLLCFAGAIAGKAPEMALQMADDGGGSGGGDDETIAPTTAAAAAPEPDKVEEEEEEKVEVEEVEEVEEEQPAMTSQRKCAAGQLWKRRCCNVWILA